VEQSYAQKIEELMEQLAEANRKMQEAQEKRLHEEAIAQRIEEEVARRRAEVATEANHLHYPPLKRRRTTSTIDLVFNGLPSLSSAPPPIAALFLRGEIAAAEIECTPRD
jgi:hypothetical protein